MDSRFETVDCQVCGNEEEGPVLYERSFETTVLGRAPMRLVFCERCGFLYANPRPSRAALRAHYNESAVASGAVWHAHGPGSRFETVSAFRAGFVLRALEAARRSVETAGTVLDVGCSQGDLLAAYALPGWERAGLEPSRHAAAKARARGLQVREEALEQTTYAPESFDLLTCWSVLEHVWDVRTAFEALARLLRPGGVLALCVPHGARPVAMVSECYSFEHLSHFTPGSLLRLARGFGLRPLLQEESEHSGLVVGFEKVGVQAARAIDPPDDRSELRTAVERYREDRGRFERTVRARFEEHVRGWRERGARVALFGAGEHSQFLLDLVDFGDTLEAFLDSDPAKHGSSFLRWPIHAPESIGALALDAIVISSRPFQEEMAAAIAPLAATYGIEIVRCYPELEAADATPAAA